MFEFKLTYKKQQQKPWINKEIVMHYRWILQTVYKFKKPINQHVFKICNNKTVREIIIITITKQLHRLILVDAVN